MITADFLKQMVFLELERFSSGRIKRFHDRQRKGSSTSAGFFLSHFEP